MVIFNPNIIFRHRIAGLVMVIILMNQESCADRPIVDSVIEVTESLKPSLTITDGVGRQVAIPYPLTRVVAASSYGAEMILALGAKTSLAGVGDYAKTF